MQNTEALEKQQEQREKIMENNGSGFSGWQVRLLSGVVLIWQQGKLGWQNTKDCPIYATDKLREHGEKIWKNRKAFYIVAGGMAGEIGYLLLCMNGWKGY